MRINARQMLGIGRSLHRRGDHPLKTPQQLGLACLGRARFQRIEMGGHGSPSLSQKRIILNQRITSSKVASAEAT